MVHNAQLKKKTNIYFSFYSDFRGIITTLYRDSMINLWGFKFPLILICLRINNTFAKFLKVHEFTSFKRVLLNCAHKPDYLSKYNSYLKINQKQVFYTLIDIRWKYLRYNLKMIKRRWWTNYNSGDQNTVEWLSSLYFLWITKRF